MKVKCTRQHVRPDTGDTVFTFRDSDSGLACNIVVTRIALRDMRVAPIDMAREIAEGHFRAYMRRERAATAVKK